MLFPIQKQNVSGSTQNAPAKNRLQMAIPDSHALLSLQKSIGNQAAIQFMQHKSTNVIQRKLSENQVQLIQQDVEDYYNRSSHSKTMLKKEAELIAKKYNIKKFQDVSNYYSQVFYYEKNPPVRTVKNGVLNTTAINKTPFSGSSDTQRYLLRQTYRGFDDTHLSVSFTNNPQNNSVTITSIHVSFKISSETEGVRFFWEVSNGKLKRSERSFPSGRRQAGSVSLVELEQKAVEMVKTSLYDMNCEDTNP